MILFVLIALAGFLQSSAEININFLALFAIFAGLRKGLLAGLLTGIFIGIVAEVFSSSVAGLNLMLYGGIGLLSGALKQELFYKEGIAMDFIFSFFGMLIFYGAYFAFTRTAQTGVLFTVFFSSAVSPLLFRFVE
jgi:cell shape-determining protein MreD